MASVLILAPATATARERSFDIAPMTAARSIPEFARQAGVQIIAPADGLEGVSTPRIYGRLDRRIALRRLIAGTSLEIASDDGITVVLRASRRPASTEALPEPPDIVVTGSRIRPQVDPPPAAVVSLGSEEIESRFGGISLGDQLSLLPPLRTTNTQAASTDLGVQASGQVGLNLLNLRGLGPSRTLVLINGRRVVSSTQLVSQPDTNTIPQALLERIDILTGGASAVYGADAIAGVVNFVLKQDFDGIRADAQTGVSARGDAATRQASLLAGRSLGDQRGSLVVALGYAARDQLSATARRFSAVRSDFVTNPRADLPGEAATIPVRDIRSLTVSSGGTLPNRAPFFRFAPDGSLNPADPGTEAFPAIGLSQGGDGANPDAKTSLLPFNERYYATLLGRYDLASVLTIYGQADFVRQAAEASAPSTIVTLAFRRDNPFLSARAGRVLDTFESTANGQDLALIRSLDDVAVLSERNTRTTLRGIVGIRGEFGPKLRYDLSYSYGRTSILKDSSGNIDLDRLRLAADATRDPATSEIVCRSGTVGCTPIDVFGAGAPSPAAIDYVSLSTRSTGRFQQHLVSGFVAGDTMGLIDLPGGAASFVAGFEFRRETTRYDPDPSDERGRTLVSAQRLVGAIDAIEAYAEATAPLLADLPGVHRLQVGSSIRASKYPQLRIGARITGGLNLLYQPRPGVSLRASWQQAMRAPNITELYQPLITGQADVTDPCDARFVGDGTPARRANCAALRLPKGFQPQVVPTRLATLTSGNPNLDVERGRTLTVGLVLERERLPAIRLAVDYHDIDLREAIAQPGTASLSPSTIAAGCVDASDIQNEYCALVRRDPSSGAITEVRQFPINLTRLRSRGVDIDGLWRIGIGHGVRFDQRLLATYLLTREDFRVPAQPEYVTRLVGTPTDPRWQATLFSNLHFSAVSLSHRLRHVSSVYYRNDDVAFFESVNGLPPINPFRRAAAFRKAGDTWYHDFTLNWAITRDRRIYLGVDNMGDKKPAFGFRGAGQSGTQFDAVGRFFYAGVRLDL